MIHKSIVEAKYKRSGLETKQTFLWSDIPLELKRQLAGRLNSSDIEMAVITYFESPEYFWVLTTVGLILINESLRTSYPYIEMEKVDLDDLFRNETNKMEKNFLSIKLVNGTFLNLRLEQKTWHAILGILNLLIANARENASK